MGVLVHAEAEHARVLELGEGSQTAGHHERVLQVVEGSGSVSRLGFAGGMPLRLVSLAAEMSPGDAADATTPEAGRGRGDARDIGRRRADAEDAVDTMMRAAEAEAEMPASISSEFRHHGSIPAAAGTTPTACTVTISLLRRRHNLPPLHSLTSSIHHAPDRHGGTPPPPLLRCNLFAGEQLRALGE